MTVAMLMIKYEDGHNDEFDDTDNKDDKDDHRAGTSHLQGCVQWVSAFCKLP